MVHMTCAVTKFCSNPLQQSLGASMSDMGSCHWADLLPEFLQQKWYLKSKSARPMGMGRVGKIFNLDFTLGHKQYWKAGSIINNKLLDHVLVIIILHDTFFSLFSHVLPMLSFFQTRSVKQTTVFRGPLEIGSQLKINVYGYIRVCCSLLRLLKILYAVLYEINTNFRHVLVIQYSYMCVANDK